MQTAAPDSITQEERRILLVLAATQFVNIVDFMIVMPLGNDFARELAIRTSHLGWIGGSYTAAAAVAGLASAFFIDRFERKRALTVAMFGLLSGTLACAFAKDFGTLLMARIVAGAFGGPASAIAIAIISDVIPPSRRGRAMGIVMMAFSLASIVGVPLGLECATHFGWRSPFYAVAGLGFLIICAAAYYLPQIRSTRDDKASALLEVRGLFRGEVLRSLLITVFAMMSAFILIPNITPFVLNNLHFPRERLGLLYAGGGVMSFLTIRAVGGLVDKLGSSKIAFAASALNAVVILAGFIFVPPTYAIPLIFVGFMMSMSFRNVAYSALTTKVPYPHERGAFQSIQSAVQHASSAVGAFASSVILSEGEGMKLVGMDKIAMASIAMGVSVPFLMVVLERALLVRERATAPSSLPLAALPPVPVEGTSPVEVPRA